MKQLAPLALVSCAAVAGSQHSSTTLLREEERTTRLDDIDLAAQGRLRGTTLVIAARATHRCRVDTLPVYEVHHWRELKLSDGTSKQAQLSLDFGLGALLALGTLGLIAGGNAGCPYTDQMTGMRKEFPAFCYSLAGVMGVPSAMMLGRGVYHALVVRTYDEGSVVAYGPETETRIEACDPSALADTSVVIQLGSLRAGGTTTSDGEIGISLLDASDHDLDGPASLFVGQQAFAIELKPSFAVVAHGVLEAEPTSRIARERGQAMLDQLTRALARSDLVVVELLVNEAPTIKDALRSSKTHRKALRKIALEDAVAILANKAATAAHEQLCKARTLISRIYGAEAWRNIAGEIHDSAMELFGLDKPMVDRALFAGCE